jgi:hypothetical protein
VLKRLRFGADAPEGRPLRAVVCRPLHDDHEPVVIEWFRDAGHLAEAPVDGVVVVAEEHVLRGADWLEARWAAGGSRFKHMAVAQRAAGLTRAEFQDRWRNRAGSVGATPIPDDAKGLAYVQNHPVPGEWAYDAVNEVWFDDEASLAVRVRWFAENLAGQEDDLVGRHRFLQVVEEVR